MIDIRPMRFAFVAATNGQITGGYAGTKALCEGVVMGVAPEGGWYTTAANAPNTTLQDCYGWTSNSSMVEAAYWQAGSPAYPATDGCQSSRPVLCCD